MRECMVKHAEGGEVLFHATIASHAQRLRLPLRSLLSKALGSAAYRATLRCGSVGLVFVVCRTGAEHSVDAHMEY